MKSETCHKDLSAKTYRSAHANQCGRLVPALAVCFGLLAVTSNSRADYCVLTASDTSGQDSFLNAQNWSPNEAPGPNTTNFTLGFSLRTPTDGNNHIFLGASLTCSNAAAAQFPNVSVVCKDTGGATITITNLTMLAGSGIGNGNNQGIGQICSIAGNMNVLGDINLSDINTAPRYIGIASTLSGTGSITNECFVIYSGNNINFTGPLVAITSISSSAYSGTIIVTNEAAMGGNPAAFNAAQLYLNGGTFAPQAGFALDHANAGVTIGPAGGWFSIPSGSTLTNEEPLAGSGTLQLTNLGTVLFTGSAASFTGTLAVNAGDFIVGNSGSLSAANTISVQSGATLDVSAAGLSMVSGETLTGNGIVIGSVTAGAGGTVAPGNGTAGTLTISGNVTLSNGTTNKFYFAATNSVIAVGGNFSASGVTTIQLGSIPAVGTYPLITVGGTLGGSAANFKVAALSTRSKSYVISYDNIGNRVLLTVSTNGSAANLVWQGDTVSGTNNVWNIDTTSNWLNGANADVYYDGDIVNFTDLGGSNQPTLDVVVNPGGVYFNSSSNYTLTTLTGAGDIAGSTSMTIGGPGTVTVSVTNTYTGGTIVTNGTYLPGVAQALGFPSGATPLASVSGAGVFNINGLALDSVYTNAIQVNGNGPSATQGAIDNTTGGLTTGGGDVGIATLTLTGNSTVSASDNWQIGLTGLGIVGNGYTLTKIGGSSTLNYLYLRTNSVSPLGNFIIAGGGVLFWDNASAVGLATPITLTNGGTIDTWNPATQYAGLTFYNPIIVSDPVNGGWILNRRTPYDHPPSDIYNGPVTLNGPINFSNVAFVAANQYNNNLDTYGKITMNGNMSGTNGVTVVGGTSVYLANGYQGGNQVIFNGNNSYSGFTMATNLVQLLISTANQSGGSYDVVDYATLDVAVAPGNPTMPIGTLVLDSQNLGPGNLSFTRLTSMPTNPVVYITNFTVVSSPSYIIPPVAGYSVGQFPLIQYSGSIGGAGFAGLTLATPPAGVTASLVNDAANHSIDLVVTTTGIVWTGAVSSNWDTGTQNWYDPTIPGATYYQDGQTVIFSDTASDFLVNVAQVVQPAGVTVNATNNYIFINNGVGSINGGAALIKNGPGTLTVACTNNNFTGGTFINAGTLMLADTNYVYPYGGGALNNNLGNVTVANGGTLDINAIQVPNYQSFSPDGYNVYISGSGAGGNGALVNNNTNNNDNADPGYVTLVGNATVGGTGDINIRHGVSPQMSSQSGNYTLTKVGPDQFRVRYVATVSTNFGPINILQGIVSYESSSTLGFGDPSKPIYVANGAGFAWGTTNANCVRPLICSNNATIYGYNVVNNVFNSPVTLVSGNVNLNANFYDGMIFNNVISGAGGLTLQFQSLATLAAANTYSGSTIVADCNTASGTNNGSVLTLLGNGSINNSSGIWLQGIAAGQAYPGALDASQRVDGTLTLPGGQTLRGDNGSYVKGNVVASAGAAVMPGGPTNIQYMTFSNNLTLSAGSSVDMDVDLDSGITNDLIQVAGTNNYGGTLQLTNDGVTPLTNGASFKLFNNAHFTGNFAGISGSPGSGLAWSFNPTNGVATVIATVIVPTIPPKITSISLAGANAVLNGTNGVNGGTYYLLESTNVTLPLSQWVPVATNVMSASGALNGFTLTETNVVNANAKQLFYILSNNP